MVEDAITTCISVGGYREEVVYGMNCENLQAVHASVKRVEARTRMWELNAMSSAANPGENGKNVKLMIQSLGTWIPRAELKQSMKNGSELGKRKGLIKKG